MAEMKKELTPEQLEKRRAKNRARSEKKKLARQEEQKNNAPAQNKPTNQTNQRPQRQSEEEYLKGLISSKSERIQRDPRNSVVSTAEAYESRTLAFAVREVNTIADYVRNNFGTEKVSTDVGWFVLSWSIVFLLFLSC
jgi:septal ring factor EnvC (AmiA/AmiB activator)